MAGTLKVLPPRRLTALSWTLYVVAGVKQFLKVALSLDVFGDPAGLIRGIKDDVANYRNRRAGVGIAKVAQSTVGGTFGALGKSMNEFGNVAKKWGKLPDRDGAPPEHALEGGVVCRGCDVGHERQLHEPGRPLDRGLKVAGGARGHAHVRGHGHGRPSTCTRT